MPTDRTALLAVGAGVGAFFLGRMLEGSGSAGTVDGGAIAAPSTVGSSNQGDNATIDFPGVLSGVYPITDQFGNPVTPPDGGGLPGGGGVVNPPPPGTTPPPATTPTPTYPATLGPKPIGATGWIAVSGGAFFRYVVNGARTSYSGRVFSAWVSGPVNVKWSGGVASCYTVLSSAYAGWRIGTASPAVAFHRV